MTEKTNKNDFVEIVFTGKANGEVFDSNIPEDLKKLNSEAKPEKTIIVISQKMVVPGLDKALEDKELNKKYEISLSPKEGFGIRDRNLIKTIPLKAFHEQKVNPQAGMMLALNNQPVKILAVSGARVTTDFNNSLAGKELKYKFTITRKVTDTKEKSETLFKLFFRFLPEFEVKEKEVTIKAQKDFKPLVDLYKDKFKGLIGKDLVFEELKSSQGADESRGSASKNDYEETKKHNLKSSQGADEKKDIPKETKEEKKEHKEVPQETKEEKKEEVEEKKELSKEEKKKPNDS